MANLFSGPGENFLPVPGFSENFLAIESNRIEPEIFGRIGDFGGSNRVEPAISSNFRADRRIFGHFPAVAGQKPKILAIFLTKPAVAGHFSLEPGRRRRKCEGKSGFRRESVSGRTIFSERQKGALVERPNLRNLRKFFSYYIGNTFFLRVFESKRFGQNPRKKYLGFTGILGGTKIRGIFLLYGHGLQINFH